MKRTLLALVAVSSLAAGGTALAQPPWQSINDRQAGLEQRINDGIRNGSLTRDEAEGLRREFNSIARMEADYRASPPGLTPQERSDLDHRFDALSARIFSQRHDGDTRGDRGGYDRGGYDRGGRGFGDWRSISDRRQDLEMRIDRSRDRGRISGREAYRLHRDLADLANREMRYRNSAPGLTRAERDELDRRLDMISRQLREDRRD